MANGLASCPEDFQGKGQENKKKKRSSEEVCGKHMEKGTKYENYLNSGGRENTCSTQVIPLGASQYSLA